MKKITAILFSALLALSLAACGNNNQNTGEDATAENAAESTGTSGTIEAGNGR